MEQTVSAVAEHVLARFRKTPKEQRLLVGIAGVPGSGKSTLAYPLVDRLNALLGVTVKEPSQVDLEDIVAAPGSDHAQDEVAVAVGLDGWHFPRAALDRFPDPAEARRRRGAAFTFDAEAYVSFIRTLRADPHRPVPFPTFVHSLKDPQPSRVPILPSHRIIVIEGLYCLLDIKPWSEAARTLDERIWVDVEREVARERLVKRHLHTGVETELAAAEQRVDGSDMLNGDFIRQNLVEPTLRVNSRDDPLFAASVA
ncbi:hypothetical protein JCM3770_000233 [Rhodotorula araucariae]